MRHIDPTTELKDRILLLEHRKAAELNLLKAQFNQTAETLKPSNIIKGALHETAQSPGIVNKIVDAGIGVTAGYLAKKVFTGETKVMMKKLFGLLIQIVVTNTVVKNSGKIKSAGYRLVKEMVQSKN